MSLFTKRRKQRKQSQQKEREALTSGFQKVKDGIKAQLKGVKGGN